MTPDIAPALDELVHRARGARERAYARYSQFKVGAALLTRDGAVFIGCNVENATYGATLCAERVAVASMVLAGACDIVAVAVFSDGDVLAMPCGICRQTLIEFGAGDTVVVAASPRERRVSTLGALLPDPFVFRT